MFMNTLKDIERVIDTKREIKGDKKREIDRQMDSFNKERKGKKSNEECGQDTEGPRDTS